MIIGTAGHVDHGKTTLIRALTGVETDRLAEEKARGISIELGFAYATLGGTTGSAVDTSPPAAAIADAQIDARAPDEPIGFIDVPGHRQFVQTMIAGAAGIDLGLLVVAADDGPMPQTREHLDILRWLGVPDLVVALSKVDRVDEPGRQAATDALVELLDRTPYRGARIVPVSAVSGVGVDLLARTLLAHRQGVGAQSVGDPAEAAHAHGQFRLAVDRAFVLHGIGLVVTGTCFAGRVAIDDRMVLLPGGLEARVRTIHAQNRPVQEACTGQRIALNLVGRGVEKSTVHRGDWIVAPAIAVESDRVDVQLIGAITCSSTRTAGAIDARRWRNVRFHAGAMSCNARVVLLDPAAPEPASDAPHARIAQIAFERPVHLVAGDRFVLREPAAEEATGSIAGGIVLDVDVPTRGRRSAARLQFLDVASRGDARAALAHALDENPRGIDLARWNRTHNTRFDAASLAAIAVAHATTVGEPSDPMLFSAASWERLQARIVEVLAAEHLRAPDAVGPGRDRLRRMATPALDAAVFAALLDTLKRDGRIAQTGAWLHLSLHRVELSSIDRQRFERARLLIERSADANPPRVRDVARALGEEEGAIRSLMVRLAASGELYRVAHDHYFLPATVQALARVAADLSASDGVARAAAFRDRIGVGRKVAIQILEFFDRVGYTRRNGDGHRVIQPTLFDA